MGVKWSQPKREEVVGDMAEEMGRPEPFGSQPISS